MFNKSYHKSLYEILIQTSYLVSIRDEFDSKDFQFSLKNKKGIK